jgi:hypothetical protein
MYDFRRAFNIIPLAFEIILLDLSLSYDGIPSSIKDIISNPVNNEFDPYRSAQPMIMTKIPECFKNYIKSDKSINFVSDSSQLYNHPNILSAESQERLENIIGHRMLDVITLKYDKDINLSEIKRNYILVCDSVDKLYVITYEPGEAYTNEEYLKHIKNLDNYLGGIPIDRSKYKK